jgi:alpha-amylase/4-alpha-glucanotransferase-like protein
MGGGHNPAAYYETEAGREPHDVAGTVAETGRLAFGNSDAGVRIEAVLSEPARAEWFPVETVSNSEAGFERIYQGSCLTFQWPVALKPGQREEWSVSFEADQSRDLTAEELGTERQHVRVG